MEVALADMAEAAEEDVIEKAGVYTMSMQSQVKAVLNDLIDFAYQTEDVNARKRYKTFRLYFERKKATTVDGRYSHADRTVYVYNEPSTLKECIRACLHNVAHHIDWCKNGVVNEEHQSTFYRAYTDLVYATLDMKVLTVDDYNTIWSPDSNKVNQGIVEMWRPHYVDYDIDKAIARAYETRKGDYDGPQKGGTRPAASTSNTINAAPLLTSASTGAVTVDPNEPRVEFVVRNAYMRRNELDAVGYGWRHAIKAYVKSVPESLAHREERWLQDSGFDCYAVGGRDMSDGPRLGIYIRGKTYNYRDSLRRRGFQIDKRSIDGRIATYYRSVPAAYANDVFARLQQVQDYRQFEITLGDAPADGRRDTASWDQEG